MLLARDSLQGTQGEEMTDREALTQLGQRLATEARNAEKRASATRLPAAFARGYEPLSGICRCKGEHWAKDRVVRPDPPQPTPTRVTLADGDGLDARRLALMGLGDSVCIWDAEER